MRSRRAPSREWDVELELPGYSPVYEGESRAIAQAARLLTHAQRPLIMAGNGVILSGAHEALRALAERLGVPVVTTLHGMGAFPQEHPLSLGMPGMHGWVHVNRAIQECDVLFNVGGRFDDRVTGKASTFAPRARVIHVDVDPSEIGKIIPVTVGIVGDARRVLDEMVRIVPERTARRLGDAHPRDAGDPPAAPARTCGAPTPRRSCRTTSSPA